MKIKAKNQEGKKEKLVETLERAAHQIGILIVDDHPVIRYALTNILSAEPDFCVLGEAASCTECREKVVSLRPNIVILDLEMEDARGVEALTDLRNAHPNVSILIYTSFSDDWHLLEAIKSDIQGYLSKDAPTEALIDAVRLIHTGKKYLDPATTSKVMGQLGQTQTQREKRITKPLSNREKAVLRLLAEGKRNREIADRLFVSERTIKFHVSSVFEKLSVSNRTEAALVVREYGSILM